MQAFTIHALGPVLALTLAIASPVAASEMAQIALLSTDDNHVHFEVSGTWPDTCPPQLLDVSADGRDITLLAARETEGCRDIPTPYAFSSSVLPRADALPGDGTHRVRLEVGGASGQQAVLTSFSLVPGAQQRNTTLESGFWWAEQAGEFSGGPGLGLSVETQTGLLSLSVMGYDEHGDSAWYFGAGKLADGIAHLELGQFEGGAGPFLPYAAPETIRLSGFVDVEAVSPSHAVLWFSQPDPETGGIRLKPLSVRRFSFAQEPGQSFLGRWLVAGTRAETRDTRWVDFVRSEVFPGGFVLYDETETTSLQCDTPPDRPESPPSICRLDTDDGDSIEFTDIALRRLSGHDANGQDTTAFRLD